MNIYQKLKESGYNTDGLVSPLKIDPPKGKKKTKSGFETAILKPGENAKYGDLMYRYSPEEIALQKEKKKLKEKEREMQSKMFTPF